jgi:hypothetical protein
MRALTLLVCLLLLLWPAPQAQQERVFIYQRNERVDGIHLVVGFDTFNHSPRIQVEGGRLGTVSIAEAQGQFYGTVAARLDLRDSRLLLDGRVVAEQRCLWLPVVRRLSSESLSLVSHLNRPRVDRYYSMASCVGMEL